jgi:hypothetical protein
MIDTLRQTLAAFYVALILAVAYSATAPNDEPAELQCLILCEG